MTYGKLIYSLSNFSAELWVKLDRGPRSPSALVQVGDFALNITQQNTISVSLPPLGLGSSRKVVVFGNATLSNETWHHVSTSWSGVTGKLVVYLDGGSKIETVHNLHGSLNLSASLLLGSSLSASGVRMTQVRLWKTAANMGLHNVMIDPSSVNIGEGKHLLAYYPFSGVHTFLDTVRTLTNPGSDRSTIRMDSNGFTKTTQDLIMSDIIENCQQNCDTQSHLFTVDMSQLFLDVYHF